jgi:hypothetical protein
MQKSHHALRRPSRATQGRWHVDACRSGDRRAGRRPPRARAEQRSSRRSNQAAFIGRQARVLTDVHQTAATDEEHKRAGRRAAPRWTTASPTPWALRDGRALRLHSFADRGDAVRSAQLTGGPEEPATSAAWRSPARASSLTCTARESPTGEASSREPVLVPLLAPRVQQVPDRGYSPFDVAVAEVAEAED